MSTVLHLRSSNGFFGAEQVIANLLQGLPERGHEARLALLDDGNGQLRHVVERFRHEGVEPLCIPCARGLDRSALRRVSETAAALDAKLIHSHDVKSDLYAALVGGGRLRRVATQHGRTGDTTRMRIYERIDALVLRAFDRIVVVSAEQLPGGPGRGHGRWCWIPNGVDTEAFRPRRGEGGAGRWGMGAECFVLGMFARLTREKNHALALRAMARLADMPNLRLVILGDGPLREELRALCASLGLEGVVHFAGYQADVRGAFDAIDAYLSTSTTEGMPMTILEAMASGVPVVGTCVGSVPGLLAEGRGCLLEEPGPGQVAEAVRDLVADPKGRAEMARRAREYVMQSFSLAHQARRYANLYEELLDR